MGTRVDSEYEMWRKHITTAGEYVLGRSCTYESDFSRLTARIFVHKLIDGHEAKIGEISIYVERDDWKQKANLDNAVEADKQLKETALSAKQGNWDQGVLKGMLDQGFQEIKNQLQEYEKEGIEVAGEFALQ